MTKPARSPAWPACSATSIRTATSFRRGAFAKSLDSGTPVPVIWAHKADDPRNYVGDVVSATETDEGLEVTGRLDLGTEHGAAAYRNIKGRRVSGLSIGYLIRNSTKSAAGNELTDLELVEVSIVARGFALWAWCQVQMDRSALPSDRLIVALIFPDERPSNRRYWLLINGGDAELCYSDPGGQPDLVVEAGSRAFVD